MLLFKKCPSAIMQSKMPSYPSIGESSLAQCYDLHIYILWLAFSGRINLMYVSSKNLESLELMPQSFHFGDQYLEFDFL